MGKEGEGILVYYCIPQRDRVADAGRIIFVAGRLANRGDSNAQTLTFPLRVRS
jgi:hypothetical protein